MPLHPARQSEIEWWKSRFDLLWKWDIRYVEDGKNFCTTKYDIVNKRAVIYYCDIDNEDDYVLHEMLKIAYLEARLSPDNANKFLEDLTTLILDRGIRV
jgi:hypothetical protein